MSEADRHARFERLARSLGSDLFRYALWLCGNEALARDLVQETYLRAFRAFEDFELRDYGAKPWLLKILYNVFYTRRSKASREPKLIEDSNFDQFTDAAPPQAMGSLVERGSMLTKVLPPSDER